MYNLLLLGQDQIAIKKDDIISLSSHRNRRAVLTWISMGQIEKNNPLNKKDTLFPERI